MHNYLGRNVYTFDGPSSKTVHTLDSGAINTRFLISTLVFRANIKQLILSGAAVISILGCIQNFWPLKLVVNNHLCSSF